MEDDNLKPFIKRNATTGEMIAGFLNLMTGEFKPEKEITNEIDIDDFLEEHELTLVLISTM